MPTSLPSDISRSPQSRPKPQTASTPQYGTRAGLRSGFRSRPTAAFARTFRVNPETLLRKPRQSPKARAPTQHPNQRARASPSHPATIIQSIESPLRKDPNPITDTAPIQVPTHEPPDSSPDSDPDPLQTLYRCLLPPSEPFDDAGTSLPPADADPDPPRPSHRGWGYVPRPDGEAAAAVDEMALDLGTPEQEGGRGMGSAAGSGVVVASDRVWYDYGPVTFDAEPSFIAGRRGKGW